MIKEFKAQVGSDKTEIKTFKHISRSDFQFEYAKKVSESEGFNFFCADFTFDEESSNYKGPFALMYYRHNKLTLDWVGQKRVLRHLEHK